MHTETDIQKITAHIPRQLLREAQAVTGAGITETLKKGLERIAHDKAYETMLKLKGAYIFPLRLDELRKDRGER